MAEKFWMADHEADTIVEVEAARWGDEPDDGWRVAESRAILREGKDLFRTPKGAVVALIAGHLGSADYYKRLIDQEYKKIAQVRNSFADELKAEE